MPRVVGVIFRKGCKVYDFDARSLELQRGDSVVVETARGLEVATVAVPPHDVEEEELTQPLEPVVRRATAEDMETVAAHKALREEALATCRRLVAKHGLAMKLVDAEVMFGGDKIVVSFFAEERVDFRALVVDLARSLKMRIELRQVGVRDEARLFGGLGPCGRYLCCTQIQVDQEPVSIRMAKEQNLPLNPMKISGVCGRLMCCLKYEQEQYVAFRKEAPRRGTVVQCSRGQGVVAGYQVPKDSLVIKFADGTLAEEKLSGIQVSTATAEECCTPAEEAVAEPEVAAAPVSLADLGALAELGDEVKAGEEAAGQDAGSEEAGSEEARSEATSEVEAVALELTSSVYEVGEESADTECSAEEMISVQGESSVVAEGSKGRRRRRRSRSKKTQSRGTGEEGRPDGAARPPEGSA